MPKIVETKDLEIIQYNDSNEVYLEGLTTFDSGNYQLECNVEVVKNINEVEGPAVILFPISNENGENYVKLNRTKLGDMDLAELETLSVKIGVNENGNGGTNENSTTPTHKPQSIGIKRKIRKPIKD